MRARAKGAAKPAKRKRRVKAKRKSKAPSKGKPRAKAVAKPKRAATRRAVRKPARATKSRVQSKAKRRPRAQAKAKSAAGESLAVEAPASAGTSGLVSGSKPERSGSQLDALEAQAIREAAARAFQKQKDGKALSQQDLAALRRYEAWRLLDAFYEVAKALPQHVLVDLLGSPKKMLLEWQKAGMPRNTDRRRTYDLFAVVGWLKARWLKNPEADAARLSSDAKARLNAAKATRAELELATQRGELVAVSDVVAEAGALTMRIRNNFLAMPAKLAGRLEGLDAASIERVLDGEVRDGLTELADRWGGRQMDTDARR